MMARFTLHVLFLIISARVSGQAPENGNINFLSSTMKKIVPENAAIEKVAEGFGFTEGPVWCADGYLLFSDIPNNVIYKYIPGEGTSLFIEKSGYVGSQITGNNGGSNGLTFDPSGHLIICQHGARQVVMQTGSQVFRPLARHFQAMRLNSPNDVVVRSDGLIYFTDPPWGLPEKDDDPSKELPFQGLFLLRNNDLIVLDSTLSRPNGLTFSPDEDILYVGDLNGKRKEYYRYNVSSDGTLLNKRLFFDASNLPGDGSPDGMKTDEKGFLYFTGPGGVLVISPKGEHIGTISPSETPANLAWGGQDGKTLYMTCRTGLYKIRLKNQGVRNWMH